MGKHAQLVIGPAGSGKSTYCASMAKFLKDSQKRTVHVVNLDPAASDLIYEPSIDIRSLVTAQDIAESFEYGPNGALLAAFDYLAENLDWFEDEISDYPDDYLIIDCPGQIELYAHYPVLRRFVKCLQQRLGYTVCSVCLLDASFVLDVPKFVAGSLVCLSAMCSLELPHINVLSKCDLLPQGTENEDLQKFLVPDRHELEYLLTRTSVNQTKAARRMHKAMAGLLDQFSLVAFSALNWKEEESVDNVLYQIDNVLQYGEDAEPREDDYIPKDPAAENEGEAAGGFE
jgi:GTPase SAR1 family protein